MTFILDTDILGGSEFTYVETPIEDRGRAIQMTWSQGSANQDFEIYGYAVRAFPAETDSKESS